MARNWFPPVRSGRSWSLSVWAAALCLGTALGVYTLLAAELGTAPSARDRQVARLVTKLMREQHLTRHALDDEISQRGFKTFLKTLDPWKMYFYQSDFEEFGKKKNDLDDMLRDGDISFAYTVFQRFQQRLDERLKSIEQLIGSDLDFTTHEEIVKDPDVAVYPKDEAEAKDRWRRRIKLDFLQLKGDKVELADAKDRLTRRYRSLVRRWKQTDSDELMELYLTSLTTAYDPHTNYMSPSTQDNFEIQMRLQLDGIGAALQVVDGYTVVSKIIPGGAADKEGQLKPEDRIMTVAQGETGEMIDVVDMKLNDVVDKIRGKAGTTVRLGVVSPGNPETKVISIVRAKIELKDSEARGVIFEEGKKPDGSPIKIGFIDLPSFYMDMAGARQGVQDFKSTSRDVKKILDDFTSQGVDGVILDLRHNGGGSLTEAIKLTGLFIDQGPVVQVKDPDGRVEHYDDTDRGMAWDGPLVVLCSKFSASASEILAGAIQDYQRGIIVGDEATHGKGTVQSLMDLRPQQFAANPKALNLGALKVTMQQFYRPNGDSTQKRGVLSDIRLPSITNHMDVAESDLDYALEFDKVNAARYGKSDLVNAALLARLTTNSEARRAQQEDFNKQAKRIERYKEYKAKKSVTLNEAEYFSQADAINAEKDEEKNADRQGNDLENKPTNPPKKGSKVDDEVVKRDFYINEVINIATDYVNELRAKRVVKAN